MSLDAALLVILAVMLYARVGAGRAVPLVAFGVACATWAVLLLARVGAQIFGAILRLGGFDPNTYYTPTSALLEIYGLIAVTVYCLLGAALLVTVLAAAALTPLREHESS